MPSASPSLPPPRQVARALRQESGETLSSDLIALQAGAGRTVVDIDCGTGKFRAVLDGTGFDKYGRIGLVAARRRA